MSLVNRHDNFHKTKSYNKNIRNPKNATSNDESSVTYTSPKDNNDNFVVKKEIYQKSKNKKELELNEDHTRSYNGSMNPSKNSKSNANVIIKNITKSFFRNI